LFNEKYFIEKNKIKLWQEQKERVREKQRKERRKEKEGVIKFSLAPCFYLHRKLCLSSIEASEQGK
jgi:hypothetical protein